MSKLIQIIGTTLITSGLIFGAGCEELTMSQTEKEQKAERAGEIAKKIQENKQNLKVGDNVIVDGSGETQTHSKDGSRGYYQGMRNDQALVVFHYLAGSPHASGVPVMLQIEFQYLAKVQETGKQKIEQLKKISGEPTVVSINDLVSNPEKYRGKLVSVIAPIESINSNVSGYCKNNWVILSDDKNYLDVYFQKCGNQSTFLKGKMELAQKKAWKIKVTGEVNKNNFVGDFVRAYSITMGNKTFEF